MTESNLDTQKITQLIESAYPENVRSGLGSRYASMFTEDAIWMPPDSPDRYGPKQIEEGFGEVAKMFRIDPTLRIEEIQLLNEDSALVLGKAEVKFFSKGDHDDWFPIFRPVWFLKRVSGEWKISRQIWNVKPSE